LIFTRPGIDENGIAVRPFAPEDVRVLFSPPVYRTVKLIEPEYVLDVIRSFLVRFAPDNIVVEIGTVVDLL
jgi:hypothetical protein